MPSETKKSWFSNNKYPTKVYLMCGWPLLLVLIGGAIGGLLAALAFSINLKIYKSDLPNIAKIILNILTGFMALILCFMIGLYLRSYFLSK